MQYPLFRKYSHNRTYFKILNESMFEELTTLGKSYSHKSITAKILPDRNFISDMIANTENNWISISEAEFQEKLQYCKIHFHLKSF